VNDILCLKRCFCIWTGNIGKGLASNYINISLVSRRILINQTFLERAVFAVHEVIIFMTSLLKLSVVQRQRCCSLDVDVTKMDENGVDERRLEMF
jgi:hypothetical protein